MDYFRTNFPNENITPKMHLWEDHMHSGVGVKI